MKALFKLNLDSIGVGTLKFCPIHYLITPFILVLLPSAGFLFFALDTIFGFETTEIIFSIIGGNFVVVALYKNRKLLKAHKVV